jgi:hypothetical protein
MRPLLKDDPADYDTPFVRAFQSVLGTITPTENDMRVANRLVQRIFRAQKAALQPPKPTAEEKQALAQERERALAAASAARRIADRKEWAATVADRRASPWTRWAALNNLFTDEMYYELIAMRYRDFLATDYWSVVRGEMLRKAKQKCQMCYSPLALNVHHKTYEHHGLEHDYLDEDLIVLCQPCHAKFHNKLAEVPE